MGSRAVRPKRKEAHFDRPFQGAYQLNCDQALAESEDTLFVELGDVLFGQTVKRDELLFGQTQCCLDCVAGIISQLLHELFICDSWHGEWGER